MHGLTCVCHARQALEAEQRRKEEAERRQEMELQMSDDESESEGVEEEQPRSASPKWFSLRGLTRGLTGSTLFSSTS